MRILTLALLLLGLLAAQPASGQIRGINNAVAGQCTGSAVYDASTNGRTELVAAATGKAVYVCGFIFWTGAAATNVSLVYGTGTACATGETALTPAFQFAANSGIVDDAALWNGIWVPEGKALCVKTSAGNAVQALVKYVQQVPY